MGHKKVCFSCRKAFNLDADFTRCYSLRCTDCGHTMKELSHNFRPPKKNDIAMWNVVNFLVDHGFTYHHIYRNTKDANGLRVIESPVAYPTKMADAQLFVEEFKEQAVKVC